MEPTDHWLRYYGLERWQAVFDQDGDGATAEEEFNYGTDPLDPMSRPPHFVFAPGGLSFQIEITPGVSFGASELQTSTDLRVWTPVPGFPPAAPAIFSVASLPGDTYRFYRFGTPGLLNSDGDCLLDFEELTLFHTDPFKTDTDGDGINDCDEVLLYHTNPNYASPTGRGAISGKVVLDADGNPNTHAGSGLAGWTVFLDLDYDGQPGVFEPSAATAADGSFVLSQLDPGLYRVRVVPKPAWLQVFPALSPPASPDGYPDRVVNYFNSGLGFTNVPYGKKASPLPEPYLILNWPSEPVDLSIVLGPPTLPIAAPVGVWTTADFLTLPKDSSVTLAFDGEEIFDGPGDDFIVQWDRDAGQNAELYLGSTESNLTLVATNIPVDPYPVDLAKLSVQPPQPVRFVKIKSLNSNGPFKGFDLAGLTALNYRALPQGGYDVTVVGGQTVSDVDFGVIGDDRPPHVFLSLHNYDVRAGQAALLTVTASDDLGLSNVTLRANGQAIPLDANLQASFTPSSGGLSQLVAEATDTAGQKSDALLALVVRNADGSLPDLSGLVLAGGSSASGPAISVISPVTGEILATPRDIVGTISGPASAIASWRVDYGRTW